MKQQSELAVLICGAGAAGLTLAIDLARRGVTFRIVDKLEAPFPGSRGKGIQPRTQEVFEDLGVIDRLVAAGGIYPRQREYRPDGSFHDSDVVEAADAGLGVPFNLPLMVPQFLTERILRERLAELGHHVEFGCALVGFEQDGDGIGARLATSVGEETVRLDYLIGADGGRSAVRAALGIPFPGKTLGVRAVVADVAMSGLSREVWHRFSNGDMERQIAICPLAGTDLFQIQAPIPPAGEVDLSPSGLDAFVAHRTGRNDLCVEAVSWATAYTMNARLADRYRVGRVFLVGDAAHIHPPTGGQGLNTSVQDAYNLGWKLAAVLTGAPDALLDTYEEERRPIAADMLGLSTGLLDQMKQGVLRRGREVHQLDIGYPSSSLACEAPERRGVLLAGDRAPDACLRGAGGLRRRLFDLFAGPHWTLLGCDIDRDRVAPRSGLRIHDVGIGRELEDTAGQFAQGYALGDGDVVLVRPDGYVGAIVSHEQLDTLHRYFAMVGL